MHKYVHVCIFYIYIERERDTYAYKALRTESRTARIVLSMVYSDHEAAERDFFINNLLVRMHLIIEMILVDRPCAMEV